MVALKQQIRVIIETKHFVFSSSKNLKIKICLKIILPDSWFKGETQAKEQDHKVNIWTQKERDARKEQNFNR